MECCLLAKYFIFRESDEKLKDELVEKLKANIPEAKISLGVGEGGLILILIRTDLLEAFNLLYTCRCSTFEYPHEIHYSKVAGFNELLAGT